MAQHDTDRAARTLSRRLGHRPDADVPVSTYRLQLNANFTFADAQARLDYFQSLGITHLYLSPILTAAPGSTHFYDVVDHSTIAQELGGEEGLRSLAAAAHLRGMGLVVDVVPNHMSVPTPVYHNAALWSVLSEGAESAFAHWFDVDWASGDPVLMPVLGDRLGTVLARGELTLTEAVIPGSGNNQPVPVLTYYDHVFPVAAGTEHLPLESLVEHQHYRLAYWRVANEELNYRRFFDVGSLVALRIEDPDVFHATHDTLVALVKDGTITGLRIDHPDGLADPGGYLERLDEATDGAWVVVEKILEDEERMPASWRSAGTTGYDAAWRIGALLRDPSGAAPLAGTMHRLTGDSMGELGSIIIEAKREIVKESLSSEIHRLTGLAHSICHSDVRLRDHTWRALYDCIRTMVLAFDRYRAYITPGRDPHPRSLEAIQSAAAEARSVLDSERHETLDVVVDLLTGLEVGSAGRTDEALRTELVTRFQQACGAVMAKGIEDTAYYRWTHLMSLCEVGSPAHRFSLAPTAFHSWAAEHQQVFPHAMTCLTTHDIKRSEDVRAVLNVLSEVATEWDETVNTLRSHSAAYRSGLVDGRVENLWWQTVVATATEDGLMAWERLEMYLTKAMREAKTHTTWTSVNNDYETAVTEFARACHADDQIRTVVADFRTRIAAGVRASIVSQKVLQLTCPGVPDTYQGNEGLAPSLVDPDNRRGVDFDVLAARLERLDDGAKPKTLDDEKLWVTAQALRARRDHAAAVVGLKAGYVPLPTSSANAVVFARTEDGEPRLITVASRTALEVDALGGWADHTLALPEGRWRCVFTGQEYSGDQVPLRYVLAEHPVSVLVPA